MSERSILIAPLQLLHPAEPSPHLDRACGGDPALRLRVERLLTTFEQAGGFMRAPAADLLPTCDEPPPAERPGSVMGPYKLVEPIGEGGMGTVWLAQQTE